MSFESPHKIFHFEVTQRPRLVQELYLRKALLELKSIERSLDGIIHGGDWKTVR